MNELALVEVQVKELRSKTLEELFEEACEYGCISLFEHDTDNTFSFHIKFECIPGARLEASSDFKQESIAGAIIQAIIQARKIAAQFR